MYRISIDVRRAADRCFLLRYCRNPRSSPRFGPLSKLEGLVKEYQIREWDDSLIP